MKIEDRVINESLTVLAGFKFDLETVLQKLEARRAELVDLLEDKVRSRECAHWKAPHPEDRWAFCRNRDDVCDGDSAVCSTYFEPRAES